MLLHELFEPSLAASLAFSRYLAGFHSLTTAHLGPLLAEHPKPLLLTATAL
jgi:hypothetical protein